MVTQLLLIRISVSYTLEILNANFVDQIQVVSLNVKRLTVLNTPEMINVINIIPNALIMVKVVLKNRVFAQDM